MKVSLSQNQKTLILIISSHLMDAYYHLKMRVLTFFFTTCVFHHIEFNLHNNLFKEIHRVLKKKGRFYIFEHNPWNPVTQKMVNTCPFDKDAILLKPSYTKKTLLSLFNNQVTNYILFFPRHRIFNFFIRFEYLLRKIPLGGQYYTKTLMKNLY
jgi:SAM-dependent methyltransferase